MGDPVIRGYRGADEDALIGVWNAALPHDQIYRLSLRRKVILDPNFDPEKLLVAEIGGEVVGFCLLILRTEPFGGEMDSDTGWITAFGARPDHRRRGVGAALLGRAVELMDGRKQLLISPYLPNYFVPGVDENDHAEGLQFLLKRGFEVTSRPMSMDANIVLLDYAKWQDREDNLRARGTDVHLLGGTEIPEFLAFLRDHMPHDWLRDARELLLDFAGQVVVATRESEVVGYCQFRGEHFGPFGVREDMQGQGIGTVLLAKCLDTMRAHGLHNAWVLWTSDETAAKVYLKFGFRETRRFAVLKRELP